MARGRKRKAVEALDTPPSPQRGPSPPRKRAKSDCIGGRLAQPRSSAESRAIEELADKSRANNRTKSNNPGASHESQSAESDSEALSEGYWPVEFIVTEDKKNDRYKVNWKGDYPESWIPRSDATVALVQDWEAWKSRQPRPGRGKRFKRYSLEDLVQSTDPLSKRSRDTSSDEDACQPFAPKRKTARHIVESSPDVDLEANSTESRIIEKQASDTNTANHSSGEIVEVVPTQHKAQTVVIEINQPWSARPFAEEQTLESPSSPGLFVSESPKNSGEHNGVDEQLHSISSPCQSTFSQRSTDPASTQKVIPDSQAVCEHTYSENVDSINWQQSEALALCSAQATLAETSHSPANRSSPGIYSVEQQQSPQSTTGLVLEDFRDSASSASSPPPPEPLEKSQTDSSTGQASQRQESQGETVIRSQISLSASCTSQRQTSSAPSASESHATASSTGHDSRGQQSSQSGTASKGRGQNSGLPSSPPFRTSDRITIPTGEPSSHLPPKSDFREVSELWSLHLDNPTAETHPTYFNVDQGSSATKLARDQSSSVAKLSQSGIAGAQSPPPYSQASLRGGTSSSSHFSSSSIGAPPHPRERLGPRSPTAPLPPRPQTPSTMSASQHSSSAQDSSQPNASQETAQRGLSLREKLKARQEQAVKQLLGTPRRSSGAEGLRKTSSPPNSIQRHGPPSRSSSLFNRQVSQSQPCEEDPSRSQSENGALDLSRINAKHLEKVISSHHQVTSKDSPSEPPTVGSFPSSRLSHSPQTTGHPISRGPVDIEVALPLTRSARNLYTATIDRAKSRHEEENFLSSRNLRAFCDSIDAICLHQDLLNDGDWTQMQVDPLDSLAWAKRCSSKLQFLYKTLQSAWYEDKHIVIFVKPGSPEQILKAFLDGMDIECEHLMEPSGSSPKKKLRVTLVKTTEGVHNQTCEKADLVIGLDETFDLSSGQVQEIRKGPAVLSSYAPTVSLVVPFSIEHISRVLPSNLSEQERLVRKAQSAIMLSSEAGVMDLNKTPEEIVDELGAHNLFRIDGCYEFFATRSLKQYPLPTLDAQSFLPSSTSSAPENGGSGTRKRSPDPEDISAPNFHTKKPKLAASQEQSHSSGSTTRIADSTAAHLPSSARVGVENNQVQESNQQDKLKIEELTSQLQVVQTSESRLQSRTQMLQESLNSYVPQVASISEENKKLKAQVLNLEQQNAKVEALLATNVSLKKDIKGLQSELDAARLMLKESSIPEQRELGMAQEAARRIPVLEKRVQAKQNEYDYIMEQYHKASNHNTELTNAVEGLTEENELLKQKASGEATKVRAAFVKSRDEALQKECNRMKAQVAELERFCKRAENNSRRSRDEVKALREIRGMGASTRSSSVRASSVPVERELPSARRPIGKVSGRPGGQGVTAHGKETSELLRKAIAGK